MIRLISPLQISAFLVTLVLVFAHPYLPERKHPIWPDNQVIRVLFADSDQGGASTAEWMNESRNYWRCNLKNSQVHPFCGFHYMLNTGEDTTQGIDFTDYKRIAMDIHYDGDAQFIRLFVRHFDPTFTVQGQQVSAKHQSVRIASNELVGGISVDLEELHVSDWWRDNFQVPLEKARTDFSNIIAIGIDEFSPVHEGSHEVMISRLELRGDLISAADWYLAIILFWTLAFLTIGVRHALQLQARNQADKERIQQLRQANDELRRETDHYLQVSSTDAHTGLLNRRGAETVIKTLQAAGEQRGISALLLLQIDNLASLETAGGEEFRQEVIKQVGRFLLYQGDVNDRVCRWSSEQFLLICPTMGLQDAEQEAERLRLQIAGLQTAQHAAGELTVSAGVAEWATDMPFEQAFERASEALKQAGLSGGNQVKRQT